MPLPTKIKLKAITTSQTKLTLIAVCTDITDENKTYEAVDIGNFGLSFHISNVDSDD